MSFDAVKIIIMIFLILTIALSSYYLYLLLNNKNYEAKRHEMEMLELENQMLINKEEEISNNPETINNNTQVITDNQIVLTKEEKKTFFELADDLSTEDLNYLNEIKNYALSYDNIQMFDRKYYQVISYGQRKTICQLYIKDGHILVKINLGKIKVNKELEPIKTKPIKILVKDDNSLNEVKRQIEVGFYKQSGAIKFSMEGSN